MGGAEPAEARLEAGEAQGWVGHRLDEIGGGRVGKVVGVLVDSESGHPAWLLARMGAFGHHTVVPVRDAVAGVGRVWAPYSRDLIRAAPRVEPGSSLKGSEERELLSHYGIARDTARHAELAGRDPATTTARPT